MLENSKSDTLEILIATMNQTSFSFLDIMFGDINWTTLNILIVNQTTPENILNSNFENIRVINCFEIGLSKSRNLALKNAIGNILLITDDDVIFEKDFQNKIQNAYSENEKASVIAFCVNNEKGQLFKKYSKKTKFNLNYFDIYNIMSIEITINRNNFDGKNIQFDENFGLGTSFLFGEEAIFLSDLKKQNATMSFVPLVIASHDSISTINKVSIENQYFTLGALYFRIHNKFFWIWLFIKIIFDVKQNKIKFIEILKVLKFALKGRKFYQDSIVNRN